MSTWQKLAVLGERAVFDLSCACGLEPARRRGADDRWIYPAALPDGRRVRMLKVLVDSACQNDCGYCAQRASRDTRRLRFECDELARLFDQLVRARRAEALFLSSGLGDDPVRAMDRILHTAEIIRRRYRFFGFMHLKVLPGVERAQVEAAARLAQRISINLEVPSQARMAEIAGCKDLDGDILQRMSWIAEVVGQRAFRARGHTTQFVVGAGSETDQEVVGRVQTLYRELGLSRAYYSKFQPVPGTPLAHRPAADFRREHRLYQADFLLRKYGFSGDEIPFEADGNLSLARDPKSAWALAHPERFPLEVNRAEPELLLRVPGIGPTTAKRIVAERRTGTIRFLEDLRRLGAQADHAAPYLTFDGHTGARQLTLLYTG